MLLRKYPRHSQDQLRSFKENFSGRALPVCSKFSDKKSLCNILVF
jgi:hypothetical protein